VIESWEDVVLMFAGVKMEDENTFGTLHHLKP